MKALCLLLRGYMLKPQLGSEKWVSPEKVLFLYAMALHADTRQLFLPLLCSQLRTEVPFKTHCVRAYLWNLGSCKSGCFRCPMLHHWLPSQVVALRCHLFFFFFFQTGLLKIVMLSGCVFFKGLFLRCHSSKTPKGIFSLKNHLWAKPNCGVMDPEKTFWVVTSGWKQARMMEAGFFLLLPIFPVVKSLWPLLNSGSSEPYFSVCTGGQGELVCPAIPLNFCT